MEYSVACCFLTHDHTDALKEILDKCLKTYADHNIDICIYDDSTNDDTSSLIAEYTEKGADNLFYVDAHDATGGNHKYLLVLQGYGLPKDYDYIWPCKDRVCFGEEFISRLRDAINEGHDVVQGAFEYARWDVGENLTQSVYTDPAEFYRLYDVMTTNWECLIRKKATMLDPIDWGKYTSEYKLGPMNEFNQTLSLFFRLAEMDSCSIRICRYTDERFISSKASSNWKSEIFELWVDKWIGANFSLPSIYDSYKMEAIKGQTNLTELFGSVERMISLHIDGVFTKEIFEKYKSIWGYMTEIPLSSLEMIANGEIEKVLQATVDDFEQAFADHDFKKAWWLIASNQYFEQIYDDRTYRILAGCFNMYRQDMMQNGSSNVFAGISSVRDLSDRYSHVQ